MLKTGKDPSLLLGPIFRRRTEQNIIKFRTDSPSPPPPLPSPTNLVSPTASEWGHNDSVTMVSLGKDSEDTDSLGGIGSSSGGGSGNGSGQGISSRRLSSLASSGSGVVGADGSTPPSVTFRLPTSPQPTATSRKSLRCSSNMNTPNAEEGGSGVTMSSQPTTNADFNITPGTTPVELTRNVHFSPKNIGSGDEQSPNNNNNNNNTSTGMNSLPESPSHHYLPLVSPSTTSREETARAILLGLQQYNGGPRLLGQSLAHEGSALSPQINSLE